MTQLDLLDLILNVKEAIEILDKPRVTAHERRYVRSVLLAAERHLDTLRPQQTHENSRTTP